MNLLKLKTWEMAVLLNCQIIGLIITGILGISSIGMFFFLGFINVTILLTWFYILSENLNNKLVDNQKLNLNIFKSILIITSLSLFVFIVLGYNWISSYDLDIGPYENILNIVSPIGGFGLLYCIYFISKLLVRVEGGEDINFTKKISTFLAFSYFAIGIFWIQPRVRKIFNE